MIIGCTGNYRKEEYFSMMIGQCKNFIPALNDSKLIDFLEGPRMVLPKKDDTDARPSLITNNEGKIEWNAKRYYTSNNPTWVIKLLSYQY